MTINDKKMAESHIMLKIHGYTSHTHPTITTSAPMHHTMHRPMHGTACPLTQTPIRPHPTGRHQDYMILLLLPRQLTFLFFFVSIWCKKNFVCGLKIFSLFSYLVAQTVLEKNLFASSWMHCNYGNPKTWDKREKEREREIERERECSDIVQKRIFAHAP